VRLSSTGIRDRAHRQRRHAAPETLTLWGRLGMSMPAGRFSSCSAGVHMTSDETACWRGAIRPPPLSFGPPWASIWLGVSVPGRQTPRVHQESVPHDARTRLLRSPAWKEFEQFA
jgi:hypothetical protein